MKEYKKKIEFKEIQSLEYNLLKRFDEFQNRSQIGFSKNDYKLLVKKIEDFNREAELKNMSLPKTKKIKLINIPEYPKQKMVTPEIESIISIINIIK